MEHFDGHGPEETGLQPMPDPMDGGQYDQQEDAPKKDPWETCRAWLTESWYRLQAWWMKLRRRRHPEQDGAVCGAPGQPVVPAFRTVYHP